MDLKLDNSTLNFHWSEKEVYWASFSHKSKLETDEHLFYKGFLNGKGARQGERCLVRVKKDACGEQSYWRSYFDILSLEQQITDLFNKSVLNDDYLVVIRPHLAQIDSVSSLNRMCARNGPKEFGQEEFVVVEEFQSEDGGGAGWQRFSDMVGTCSGSSGGNNNGGASIDNNNPAAPSSRLLSILDALSHFSFVVMHGEMILCDFRGEIRDRTCCLSCPTVHSRKHKFREWGDEGVCGIKTFMAQHKCNKFCLKFACNTDNLLLSDPIEKLP